MEKVLSEKNKTIRAQQRFFERLRHRVRIFYPSAFVIDKNGVRVPYRRPSTATGPQRKIDMEKTNQLVDRFYGRSAADAEVVETNHGTVADAGDGMSPMIVDDPAPVEVGTIDHDRSVLDEAPAV